MPIDPFGDLTQPGGPLAPKGVDPLAYADLTKLPASPAVGAVADENMLYLLSPIGQIVAVTTEQLPGMNLMGYTRASPQQIQTYLKEKKLQEKYGTPLQQLATGAEQAASTMTFGAAPAIEQMLGVPAEDIRGREEANPSAATAGSIAGIALPLLLSGPAGGAAAAAGKAPGLVARAAEYTAPALLRDAGMAAARAVAPSVAPTTLAGRVASKALQGGIGSLVEGLGYGTQEVVEEGVLGDPNLTAQSALAEIGLSGVIMGGLGGVLGAASGLFPNTKGIRAAQGSMLGGFRDRFLRWRVLPGTAPDVLTNSANASISDLLMRETGDGFLAMSKMTDSLAASRADMWVTHASDIIALKNAIPGIEKRLAEAHPLSIEWAVSVKDMLVKAEKDIPGLADTLVGAPPNISQHILDDYPKIYRGARDKPVLQSIKRDVYHQTQELVRSIDHAFAQTYEDVLPKLYENVMAGLTPQQMQEARIAMQDLAKSAQIALEDAALPRYGNSAEGINLIKQAQAGLEDIQNAPDPKKFELLIKVRRRVGGLIWKSDNVISSDARTRAKELYSMMNEVLHNRNIFSEAASTLLEIDTAKAGWEAQLHPGRLEATTIFDQLMSNRRIASENKIASWIQDIGTPAGRDASRAYTELVNQSSVIAEVLERIGKSPHSPAAVVDRNALESVINRAQKLRQDAAQRALRTTELQQLQFANPKLIGVPPLDPLAEEASRVAWAGIGGTAAMTVQKGWLLGRFRAVYDWARKLDTVEHKLATLHFLESLNNKVSQKVGTGVGALVRGSSRLGPVARGETAGGVARSFSHQNSDKVALKRIEQVSQLAADPTMLADVLMEQEALFSFAPTVGQAMLQNTMRAIQFLASKVPPATPQGLFGMKRTLSPAEASRFNRYWEAVNNPLSVIKEAQAGTLTAEAVEAVSIVHPELLNMIRTVLVDHLTTHRPTDYNVIKSASVLLGMDVDGMNNPGTVLAAQLIYAQPSKKSGENQSMLPSQSALMKRPTIKGMRNIKLNERMTTPFSTENSRAQKKF